MSNLSVFVCHYAAIPLEEDFSEDASASLEREVQAFTKRDVHAASDNTFRPRMAEPIHREQAIESETSTAEDASAKQREVASMANDDGAASDVDESPLAGADDEAAVAELMARLQEEREGKAVAEEMRYDRPPVYP